MDSREELIARAIRYIDAGGYTSARTALEFALATPSPEAVGSAEAPVVLRMADPTAQTGLLTRGQQIVARYEADLLAEPCELAQMIDDALSSSRSFRAGIEAAIAAAEDERLEAKEGHEADLAYNMAIDHVVEALRALAPPAGTGEGT